MLLGNSAKRVSLIQMNAFDVEELEYEEQLVNGRASRT